MNPDEPQKPRHTIQLTKEEMAICSEISYGGTFYCGDGLRRITKVFNKAVWSKTQTLVSGGSSSCIISAAICACAGRSKLRHLHIYPDDTVGHRNTKKSISGPWSSFSSKHIAIVDDLIDSGATVLSLFKRYMIQTTAPKTFYVYVAKIMGLEAIRDFYEDEYVARCSKNVDIRFFDLSTSEVIDRNAFE